MGVKVSQMQGKTELACEDEPSGDILSFMRFSSEVIFQTPQQMGQKTRGQLVRERPRLGSPPPLLFSFLINSLILIPLYNLTTISLGKNCIQFLLALFGGLYSS